MSVSATVIARPLQRHALRRRCHVERDLRARVNDEKFERRGVHAANAK
jgi:hypothetical protein